MHRPNILIVMADQMTFALTGAYGHRVVRTPALDRLSAEGVRFDAAYTPCPLCAPARAAMFSGRYVSRTRTYDNGSVLASDVPTWAHHLRLAGYEVVASGKMHFVGADQLHGLEARLTPDIYPSDFSWTPGDEDYDAPDDVSHGKALTARQAGPCPGSEQIDYDDNVHAQALEFLRRRPAAGAPDRPFCLLVSYSHPHPPYLAPRRLWDLYDGADIPVPALTGIELAQRSRMERWLHGFQGLGPADAADGEFLRRLHRAYYAMVTYIDEKVDELLGALSDVGVKDRTAVIFASDHGDMLGQRRQVQKRLFYEWSARVPLIGSFPSAWPPGRAISAPVSLLDLFGTLTDLAGAAPPIDVDGCSLLGALAGDEPADAARIVFSEYHGEGVAAPCFMARQGRFKYVCAYGHDEQLFDLEADPEERCDLSGRAETRDAQARLRAAVLDRFDPDAIAADLPRSRRERRLMRDAMSRGRATRWDYRP